MLSSYGKKIFRRGGAWEGAGIMADGHNLFESLRSFEYAGGKEGRYYSLPALEEAGIGEVSRLPVSIRIVLESVLRNVDGKKVTEADARRLAGWKPNEERAA